MTDDRTPWSTPDAEPEREVDPLVRLDVGEFSLRWGSTIGFVTFGLALMWVLGTQVASWLAFAVGIVICAVPMARLWARHEDRLTDARIRAENRVGSAPYDPGPEPHRRSLSVGPGNDAPGTGESDRYGAYGE